MSVSDNRRSAVIKQISMINESKLALKQVFDNFDKDKSGFVDIAELNQIATELEQDLAPGEIDKVMAAVDHNKDGKISFQEFWEWWQYGKTCKMERLVFLKLRIMNILKKVHAEFTRHGQSLIQKYEGAGRDHHYLALNYGETLGHMRLKCSMVINGKGIAEELKPLEKYNFQTEGTQSLEGTYLLRCHKPVEAKAAFEKWLDEARPLMGAEASKEAGTNIDVQVVDQELLVTIKTKNPFISETFQQQAQVIQMMGQKQTLEQRMVQRNSYVNIPQMLAKSIPFMQFLLEGFIIEHQNTCNSQLIQNVFKSLQQMLSNLFGTGDSKEQRMLLSYLTLPLMLKSSKVHITFKSFEDVDGFIKGLGLKQMMEKQPTGRDLIYELIPDQVIVDLKNPNGREYVLSYKLMKLIQEHLVGQLSWILVSPYILIQLNLTLDGLKEFFACILREDKEGEERMKAFHERNQTKTKLY